MNKKPQIVLELEGLIEQATKEKDHYYVKSIAKKALLAISELYSIHEELVDVVNHQSNLSSLWLLNPTITEAMLQYSLRHLHAIIEGDRASSSYYKKRYWNLEDEL